MKPTLESARTVFRSGDASRAEREIRELLKQSPEQPELIHMLGCVRRERGSLPEAIEWFERAVALAPTRPEYLESLAGARLGQGEWDTAQDAALRAQRCDPNRARPVLLMGLIAMERGDLAAALKHFSKAASMEMPNLDATTNMAVALNRAGEWRPAEEWSRSALRIAPNHAPAWINLGLSLKAQRRLEEAKEAFRRGGPDPRARFNLGYTLLLEGSLAEGLPLLEARKPLLGIGRDLAKPEWNGTPHPKKTLLVVHEQGLGDTLLMCRFWPAARERFERVVALVQPPLARLLAIAFPGIEVVTSLEGVRYDMWCATMSLPWLLGIDSVDRIPLEPWIALPPVTTYEDPKRKLRIGLNWAGNPRFTFDTVRSTHLENVSILLQVPDVEWVSLHRGHLEHEAEDAGLAQPLREARDFLDTAEVIRGLDMVISTETAIPNLSAAMGIPTLILASPDWDWRWAHWYPAVSVCWQDEPGEWLPACVRALEAIRDEMIRREEQSAAAALRTHGERAA